MLKCGHILKMLEQFCKQKKVSIINSVAVNKSLLTQNWLSNQAVLCLSALKFTNLHDRFEHERNLLRALFAPYVKLQITPIPIAMNGLHLQHFIEQQKCYWIIYSMLLSYVSY